MDNHSLLFRLAGWLILATVPSATLYPIFFAFRSRWWDTDIGRALLIKGVSLMLLVDLSVVFAVTGTPASNWLRFAVFFLICISINYQFLVLLRRQRSGRMKRIREQEEEEKEDEEEKRNAE